MSELNRKKHRRPYRKPGVEKVMLTPGEAALANCKSAAVGGGKNHGACHFPTDACKRTFGS